VDLTRAVEHVSKLQAARSRGVLTSVDYRRELVEVFLAYGNELVEASRNGTLVTIHPDGSETIGH